jgi:hypothetical protein
MQEYWRPILVRQLDEAPGTTGDLVVPPNVAISVRKFGDWAGITFDSGSMVRIREMHLHAEGSHNRAATTIKVAWAEIQSITFSYKHPG